MLLTLNTTPVDGGALQGTGREARLFCQLAIAVHFLCSGSITPNAWRHCRVGRDGLREKQHWPSCRRGTERELEECV